MSPAKQRCVTIAAIAVLLASLSGCAAPYKGLVKPSPKLSLLSPEIKDLTDDKIDIYLTATARPAFPTVLAVGKVRAAGHWRNGEKLGTPEIETMRGEEAAGWRNLATGQGTAPGPIAQVQFISPLVAGENASLKGLRDAAALLHAPLLLVYMQDDDRQQGYNDAAMAYWTFIGLFCVPGNRVGQYTVCQGVLVDTRSGVILSTVGGEAKGEENVLPGAVDIAADRVAKNAQEAAVKDLQRAVREALTQLAGGAAQ
jgi:hypothetical protein